MLLTKRIISWVAVFLLPIAFNLGCASRGEIVRFKNQMDYLERSNRKLEKNVAVLDSLLQEELRETQRLRADVNSSFGSLDERLQTVGNWLRDSDSRFNELVKKMELRKEKSLAQETISEGDTSKPQVNFDPQTLYEAAHLNVIKGNYDLAILGFGDFINYFPRSSLAPSAQYWIAECHYAKNDFQKATDEFGKLLQRYPNSEKIPSALYKLGLICLEQNDRVKANKYFGELIDKYPHAPEAELAKDRMGIKD
jgi:tol-pal system protein YbgF